MGFVWYLVRAALAERVKRNTTRVRQSGRLRVEKSVQTENPGLIEKRRNPMQYDIY
ncbi:hypothetical protein PanWU01x14_335250 [Parasponia andersonii]|uniref:Uncharacterized protein n=1 Tax=Parasponia andersonii TaxID=3476 RepID=A0A2P5AGA8_PARAD|nr:hypothetical protein PanWU01x14_335250 [Parasponia andersonii]